MGLLTMVKSALNQRLNCAQNRNKLNLSRFSRLPVKEIWALISRPLFVSGYILIR